MNYVNMECVCLSVCVLHRYAWTYIIFGYSSCFNAAAILKIHQSNVVLNIKWWLRKEWLRLVGLTQSFGTDTKVKQAACADGKLWNHIFNVIIKDYHLRTSKCNHFHRRNQITWFIVGKRKFTKGLVFLILNF